MRYIVFPLAFALLLIVADGQSPGGTPVNYAPAKIGAYYFDGWNPRASHVTERLRTEFGNREPVWGWYDDTDKIMEQQIDIAANAGLSFWSFCWYWPEKNGPDSPLNNAMALFLKARNRSRLQFCVLVANHSGFRIGPEDWPSVCARWIVLFKQPTYLTVDGKPLLIFFAPDELIKSFGTTESVKTALNVLRKDAKAAGIPGVSIAACDAALPESGLERLRACGFDVFTGYNYSWAGQTDPNRKEQSFASMISGHEEIWDHFARCGALPYIPLVTTGWDKRPWESINATDAERAICYPDRSPEILEKFIGEAIKWIKSNATCATPEKLILLYAWNENGEGGYLTPTKSEGAVYLQSVTKALQGK